MAVPDPSTVLPQGADQTNNNFGASTSYPGQLATPATSSSTVIPASSVTNTTPAINYAQPTGQSSAASAALGSASTLAGTTLQSYLTSLNAGQSATNQTSDLTNAVNSLLDKTAGQAADLSSKLFTALVKSLVWLVADCPAFREVRYD